MKNILFSLLFLMSCSILFACGKDDATDDPIENPDSDPDTEKPSDENPTVSVESKPRVIWIDASANFPRYANSKENIAEDLEKVKNSGFTEIVVDVRPSMGDVLFKTEYVDQIKKLDCWIDGYYQFYERTETWDYLQAFIDKGHELGLKVIAGFNTFTGGQLHPYGLGNSGMVFRDSSKRDWVETLFTSKGPVNALDLTSTDPSDANYCDTKFLNPCNKEVQEFLLNLIGDLCKYNIDGIVLDRCRYDNLTADVSSTTRDAFQEYMGDTSITFPSDVLRPGMKSMSGAEPKYFKDFLAFRAKTIGDFIGKVVARVRKVNSSIKVGAYVGAWYSDYYTMGVNWASNRYDPSKEYSWANENYMKYGFAQKLDFLLLGCYASASSVYGNNEWSMQGFCKKANEKILGATKFYGGPDVGNPTGFEKGDAYDAVRTSVDACINSSDGYFLFDICHVRQYSYWTYLKQGIKEYLDSLKK